MDIEQGIRRMFDDVTQLALLRKNLRFVEQVMPGVTNWPAGLLVQAVTQFFQEGFNLKGTIKAHKEVRVMTHE